MFDTISDIPNVKQVVWVYWSSDQPKTTKTITTQTKNGVVFHEIYLGCFSKKKLFYMISWLDPSIVHHQGHHRSDVVEVCSGLNVPIITGVHVWNEILEFNAQYNNQNIIDNKYLHRAGSDLDQIMENSLVYSPSEFVTRAVEEVTGYNIPDVVLPISSIYPTCEELDSVPDILDRPMVVIQMSLHRLKGGCIFMDVARAQGTDCGGYKFHGYDYNHKADMAHSTNIILKKFTTDVQSVYKNARVVMIPSLVDETFCKVAYEAMIYGCIVVSSMQGNLPYIVTDESGGYVVNAATSDAWNVRMQEVLALSDEEMQRRSGMAKKTALLMRSNNANKILGMLHRGILKSKRANVMLFTVWGVQGLWIQSRAYVNLLEEHGFR